MNHRVQKLFCITLLIFFRLPITHAQQQHPSHAAWDYGDSRGPSHWGELEAGFVACKDGHQQSPIDIGNPQSADLPAIQFAYKQSPLHIIDNGHTIMVNYGPGSFLFVGNDRYELKQFHFHRPSEEKIEGKTYDMVVHLVHADEGGNLAVVAVLLEHGQANALVDELWNDLPKKKEKEELKDVEIDATRLLPEDRHYYSFSGSLTTPPCTENVKWFVLKQPVTVSSTEVERFSKIYRNNARPTQPLHDRVVLESR
jgi:carbonic anhydrase